MTDSVASLIPSFLSVGVAIYAVSLNTWQSRLAAQKLKVDFFDRRFTVWESTNAAIRRRQDHLTGSSDEDYFAGRYHEDIGRTDFFVARREAQFLFGPEVLAQYDIIDRAFIAYLGTRVEAANIMDGIAVETRIKMVQAPLGANMKVMNEQERLMALVAPYLSLSDIAVMKRSLWRQLRLMFQPK